MSHVHMTDIVKKRLIISIKHYDNDFSNVGF